MDVHDDDIFDDIILATNTIIYDTAVTFVAAFLWAVAMTLLSTSTLNPNTFL